jgi:IPT/TIG domain.
MGFSKSTFGWIISLTLLMAGCAYQPLLQEATTIPPTASLKITGQVSFDSSLKTQVTSGDVTKGAAVSLIDAVSGYTYGTSEADSAGNFTLSFYDTTASSGGGYPISPSPGVSYILEAVKGSTASSDQNHAGSDMMRIRTLLFWNQGWQSLTNSTRDNEVVVNSATTALCVVAGLKQQTGSPITFSNLIGRLYGNYFLEHGSGISNTNDYKKVLDLVNVALKRNQDPVSGIYHDNSNNSYKLTETIPHFISFSPKSAQPGDTITIYGANFDQIGNTNTFWFGQTPVSSWSISARNTIITLHLPKTVPPSPLLMKNDNGITHTIIQYP